MSTPEYAVLHQLGYSEHFLRSPFGSPQVLRAQFLYSGITPLVCTRCGGKYQLPRKQPEPALNANGDDLRYAYASTPLDNGFCSSKCEGEQHRAATGDLFGENP